MSEKVKIHDFVEVDYTGKLTDGTVFDTTVEKVAKEHNFYNPKMKFGPAVICVGEKQILPGLDGNLVDKEVGKEYTITLQPEEAFGKRDIKNMKIMPLSSFREHKMDPYPGLQVDVDGQMGTITRVSGGRVIVNFNHPLAGKEVVYTVKINSKITDKTEQITQYLNSSLRVPKDKIKVELHGENAKVSTPITFPEQINQMIGKKIAEITGLKEVTLHKSEEKIK